MKQGVWGAFRQKSSLRQDADPVGRIGDEDGVMADQKAAGAGLCGFAQGDGQDAAGRRIHPFRRFVGDQQARAPDQGGAEVGAPLPAAR